MNNQLSGLIVQGYTLITPTWRLSRHLQHQFAALQIKADRTSWETPDILPWEGWLRRIWESMALEQGLDSLLLSSQQQQYLWQGIIDRSAFAGQLLQRNNTARQVMRAWSLCQQWRIPIFPEGIYLNEDALAFQQWAKSYRQRCEKSGWIDEAMLGTVLTEVTGSINHDKKITLIGFDELFPQQLALIQKLKQTGCIVEEFPLQHRNTTTVANGFTDCCGEIYAAACWARSFLESEPDSHIGIIVPNLQTLHARIENIFDDVFLPGAILVNAEPQQRPYAISLGQPLSDYPVIAAALLILGLGDKPIALEDFSRLLRSPFINDYVKENQQRAKLDAVLRKFGEYRVTIRSLRWMQVSKRIKANDMPDSFINCYERYQQEFQAAAKKRSASDWANLFTRLLKTFNWPGERTVNSAEYQTVTEWQDLLGKFAALEVVSPVMSYKEALMLLRQLIMNTGFQPETPEAPIQILGMTGAAGMQFDHLRVTGLHAEAWSPKAEPDPFIPLKLQRELNIPDAAAETRLQQSENLLRRLILSSPDVVLSYPQNDHDRPLRPSPLIKNYLGPVQSFETKQDYAERLYHAGEQELIDDTQAPAIAAGKTVTGGTGLFKDQAACPFRAFARHRLFAEGIGSKDIGLNAMDRGSIMHDVMEKLWKRLGSQAALLAMADKDLDKAIDLVVTNIINEYKKQFPLTFTDRFTQLESERLQIITRQLLEIECQRSPFTVQACEYWHVFSLNDITIRTRIDRIDQLLDGRTVIMDYKTGARDPKVSQWFSERPDEPQLPLYAITSKGEIAAIVFTKLKRGEVAYIGLAENDELLPNVKTITNTKNVKDIPDWLSLMTQWKIVLNRLAVSFSQGDALVDPKNSDSCKYCDLHALCRIFEKNSGYGNQEPEDE